MIRSIALAAAVVVASASAAHARAEKTLAYPRDAAWATAVRFLVVDEHVKITDKDTEAGYAVFELRDDGRTYRGSLEVVAFDDDGVKSVRFVIQLADRPTWVENLMMTRLERKLGAELGAPAPAPEHKRAPDPDRDKDAPKDPPKDAPKDPPKDPPKDDDGPPISPTP